MQEFRSLSICVRWRGVRLKGIRLTGVNCTFYQRPYGYDNNRRASTARKLNVKNYWWIEKLKLRSHTMKSLKALQTR